MFETVSVDEALTKGKRSLVFYSLAIFLGVNVFYVILILLFPALVGWIAIIGLLLSFIVTWLYWSFAVTKWRLWAFENVRNVHELQKRAFKDNLIGKAGGFIEKTEIRSADDKRRWEELQVKFKQDDIFTDDLSIPAETQLRYSKNVAIFVIILGLALTIGGVCLGIFTPKHVWFAGAIMGVGGLVLTIVGYRRYTNRNPQIILNNEGVSTAKISFYSWADITGEDTKVVQQGKSSRTYFIYTCPEGDKRVDIAELDVRKSYFEKLLRVYRGRYEHRKH
jgi:hypothetical protein